MGLYSCDAQHAERALDPSFLPRIALPQPRLQHSLFWNLPYTQGPTLCFLASLASLLRRLCSEAWGSRCWTDPDSPASILLIGREREAALKGTVNCLLICANVLASCYLRGTLRHTDSLSLCCGFWCHGNSPGLAVELLSSFPEARLLARGGTRSGAVLAPACPCRCGCHPFHTSCRGQAGFLKRPSS